MSTAAIGAYYLLPAQVAGLAYVLVSLIPVIAVPLGVVHHRPRDPRPWYLLAAGQFAFFLGDALWFWIDAGGGASVPSLADAAYLVGYPLTAAAIVACIRQGRLQRRTAAAIDAAAVGVVAVTALWVLVGERFVGDASIPVLEQATLLAYPLGDGMLLAAATYLLVMRGWRGSGLATHLLVVSLLLLLVADLMYAGMWMEDAYGRSWQDLAWFGSYVAIAVAAVLPSMRHLTDLHTIEVKPDRRHVGLLCAALLSVPSLAAVQFALYGSVDLLVIGAAELVLMLLLLGRLVAMSQALIQQERRYAALLTRASDAFVVVAPDSTVVFSSPAAEAVLGIPSVDLIGRKMGDFLDLVHDDDAGTRDAVLESVMTRPGATATTHGRARHVDGTYRWISATLSNRVDDPAVGGIVINYHDVTDVVETDAELRRSYALLEHAEDLANIGSWEWEGSTGVTRWSDGLWKIVGLDPAVTLLENDTLYRHVHPDDRDRVEAETLRSYATATPLNTEFRLVQPGGATRHLRAVAAVDKSVDGSPVRIIGVCLDVTEENIAAERLMEQAHILGNVRESVIVTDAGGMVTYWNAGAEAIFGYTADEMLGQPLAHIYPDPDASVAEDLRAIVGGKEFLGDWKGRRKDGSEVWVEVHTSVMPDAAGGVTGFIGVATDATQRRAAQRMLARLGAAIRHATDSVMVANADAEIEYVNEAFERMTGYTAEEVIGRNPRLLQGAVHSREFYQAMWATLSAGNPWAADFENRRKDGTPLLQEAIVSPIREDDGSISGYVAVARDVTEQRRLEQQAQRLARERSLIAEMIRGIDPHASPEATAGAFVRQVASLTGVASAGLFVFEADGRAVPYGVSAVGFDDAPLRPVPRRRTAYLQEQAERGPWIEAWSDRPWHPYNDLFIELGIRAVAYAPMKHGDQVVGFLHVTSAADGADEALSEVLPALIEFADIAGGVIGPKVVERTEAESVRRAIRRIIRDVAFDIVFQPIFNLQQESVVGYEALTRFHDRTPPNQRFIEAQTVGVGAELELATLREAVAQAVALPPDAWLNLNVSPDLITSCDGLGPVLAGVDRRLVLEITEHAAILNYDEFRAAIAALDVDVAVDDAGAGYASFRHILELRPSMVKLDRALIAAVDVDDVRRALVAGMVAFSRSTGYRLLAEGIETVAERDALRALGVELGQGFLLGRPMRASQILAMDARSNAGNHHALRVIKPAPVHTVV